MMRTPAASSMALASRRADGQKVDDLAHALGAERAALLARARCSDVVHDLRNVVKARDLVVGERGVGDLAAVDGTSSRTS